MMWQQKPFRRLHVVGLPDPYSVPSEPASFVHLGVLPVYHMILIANMICDC